MRIPRISILFSLFLLMFAHHLFAAEKYFYFFGGGGTPIGDSTIFDADLEASAKFVNKSDWKTVVSFNGGHAKTEKILASTFRSAQNIGPFSDDNFENTLNDLEAKINKGEIANGDSLMIAIDTHGSEKLPGQISHTIVLSSNITASLDRLKNIVAMASKKGIKLALIDLSCHSGSSLSLGDEKTCVISSTGADHVALSEDGGARSFFGISQAFSPRFLKSFKTGNNLEEIFLKARQHSNPTEFPMISTQEGESINELLYRLVTPYLYYDYNDPVDPIIDFRKTYLAADLNTILCSKENQYNEFINLLDQIQQMSQISNRLIDVSDLKEALSEYREFQKRYEDLLIDEKSLKDEIKNILKRDYADNENLWSDQNEIYFLNVDYNNAIAFSNYMMQTLTNPESKNIWKENAEGLRVRKKISEEVKNKLGSETIKRINASKEMLTKTEKTFQLANKVGKEIKKVYNQLYKNSMTKKSNPCREFVL